MESRKRHPADDPQPAPPKKRVLLEVNGSPELNGGAQDPDDAQDVGLENFRKEAIYRQMKHYSREHERDQVRIVELEQRKRQCEAGLAAMSACWTQLLDTIRLLTKTEHLRNGESPPPDLFNISQHVTEDDNTDLAAALSENAMATKTLVTKFVQLGGQSPITPEDSYKQCQLVTTERNGLRSEVSLLHDRLRDSERLKNQYHSQLLAAERRADRAMSSTVQAMRPQSKGEGSSPNAEADAEPEGKTERVEESEHVKSEPSPPHLHMNGVAEPNEDLEICREQLALREQKIRELEQEVAILRDQFHNLDVAVKSVSPDIIKSSPHYRALLEHACNLEITGTATKEKLDELRTKMEIMEETITTFESEAQTAMSTSNQELKTMVQKRDSELARIREARDQRDAELLERRNREHVHTESIRQSKLLGEANASRIAALQSAITRYRTQLAANVGQEELMKWFAGQEGVEVSYHDHLKGELEASRSRIQVLEQTLSALDGDHPDVKKHIESEADARQQLEEVQRKLQRYSAAVGDMSSLDTGTLPELLHRKEEELKRLRVEFANAQTSQAALEAELDNMTSAYESLETQLKDKIFNLEGMEEKIARSQQDRAKIENKFYAAMRDKDAVEMERKNLARNLEKQAKVVQKHTETETALRGQLNLLDQETKALKRLLDGYNYNMDAVEKESGELKATVASYRKIIDEYKQQLHNREQDIARPRREAHEAREQLIAAQRKNAKLETDYQRVHEALTASFHKPTKSSGPKSTEDELRKQVGDLNRLLKCGTCKLNYSNRVIIRCGHLFCQECVESRLSTRQRKCPVCSVVFSASDVLQVYH